MQQSSIIIKGPKLEPGEKESGDLTIKPRRTCNIKIGNKQEEMIQEGKNITTISILLSKLTNKTGFLFAGQAIIKPFS